MAQAVSHRPLAAMDRVHDRISPCDICGGQSGTGTVFSSEFFGFPLSVSFHRGSTYAHISWDMNNRSVDGRSSETVSPHRHDMT
jgi:hypothetical protein